jgi:hypothetical protein
MSGATAIHALRLAVSDVACMIPHVQQTALVPRFFVAPTGTNIAELLHALIEVVLPTILFFAEEVEHRAVRRKPRVLRRQSNVFQKVVNRINVRSHICCSAVDPVHVYDAASFAVATIYHGLNFVSQLAVLPGVGLEGAACLQLAHEW